MGKKERKKRKEDNGTINSLSTLKRRFFCLDIYFEVKTFKFEKLCF